MPLRLATSPFLKPRRPSSRNTAQKDAFHSAGNLHGFKVYTPAAGKWKKARVEVGNKRAT